MAKNSIRDYSPTNSSNTDIQSIDISEGCSPAGINNAIREVMADLKDVSTGAVALESPEADSLTVTGDLTVDTNTLYVDSTNNNVGIGTTSPNTALSLSGGQISGVSSIYRGTTATTQAGITLETDGTHKFMYGAAEQMRIDSSGRVLIGDSNPDSTTEKLVVSGNGSNKPVRFMYDGSAGTYFDIDTNAANGSVVLRADARSGAYPPMVFETSASERMRIDASGNLLVGTTTVNGDNSNSMSFYKQYGQIYLNHSGTANGTYYSAFVYNGAVIGSITQGSTSSVSYNTSSDYRLKENVTPTWDATTRLKQLNPVRFNFIADADTTVDGFLAHEVQDVVPEAISGTKDEVDDDGNPVYQGIDQSKLVPLLVKTIQELEARVAALENA